MAEAWILTLVRTPTEGLTDRWHFVFGGAGDLADLTDALIRNTGDVWDNWYDHAVVERMAGVLALPGDPAAYFAGGAASVEAVNQVREQLGLTGTKYGCGIAQCGACTVHVDGQPVRSCVMPVSAVVGTKIKTIEALGSPDKLHALQAAWIAEQVPQCGYCQCGMVMTTVALLRDKPKPTDQDIDEAITNICRCGTYARMRTAIHAAAKKGTRA